MMSAPSEMRCRSMSTTSIVTMTAASVSGMAMATTRPARTPSAMKLTTRTMATACHNDSVNSPIACATVAG